MNRRLCNSVSRVLNQDRKVSLLKKGRIKSRTMNEATKCLFNGTDSARQVNGKEAELRNGEGTYPCLQVFLRIRQVGAGKDFEGLQRSLETVYEKRKTRHKG